MKKLLLLLCALLCLGGSEGWAGSIVVNSSNGTFKKKHGDAAAGTWNNYWASTSTTPQITVITNYGGDSGSGNIFGPANQTNNAITYTADIRNGYGYSFFISSTHIITKVTIQAWAQGGANKITDNTSGKQYSFTSGEAKTVEIACNAQEVINAFNIQNNTAFYANVTVYYEEITPVSTPFCTYGPTTGTFYNTGGTNVTTKNDSYASKWLSTQTNPQVTIESDANNITAPGRTSSSEGASCFFANGGKTYTISVPNSAKITGYTLVGRSYTSGGAAGNDISATTSESVNQTFKGSEDKKLEVSGKDLRSTTFTLTGTNAFLRPTWFLIYAENDPTFAADKASLSNAKSYMVHGSRGDWQYTSSEATSMTSTTTFSRTDDTRQIAFIKSATTGNYYAYSVITGKFITSSNTLSDTPEPFFIFETGNTDYPFFFSFTSDKSDKNINLTSDPAFAFNTNSTYDAGNQWCLYAAKDFEVPSAVSTAITEFETANVTATYKLVFNESVIAERDVTAAVGSAPECQWSTPSYCSISDPDVATLAAETTEVNFTLSWDGPFEFSQDYENATWYYMAIYNQYAIKTESTPYQLKDKATAIATYGNAMWAFVGNPYDGVKIINYASGDGMYLNLADYPSMVGDTPSPDKRLMHIGDNEWGFTLDKDGTYLGNYNYYETNGGIRAVPSSWSTYQHTSVTVEPVPYKDLALAFVEKYASSHALGQYFGLDETSYSNTKKTLNSVESLSKTEYDNFISNATTYLTTKYPTTGNYLMKNYYTTTYLKTTGTALNVSSGWDANAVVHITRNYNGTYNFAFQGKYIGEPTLRSVIPQANAAYNYTYEESSVPGTACFKKGENNIYLWSAGGNVTAWTGNNSGSKWIIEDVASIDITLTAATDNEGTHRYATLCVPFNITALAGAGGAEVKAYAPTKSGDYIVPGDGATTITEGTPVLLIGESGASSVTATIGTNYATSPSDENVLTGTFTGTTLNCTAETTNYVLGFDENNGNRIGFYHVDGGTAFALKANRAYLSTAGGSVKGFAINWDELVDGINTVQGSGFRVQDSAIYNLAGQRLQKLQKGVNIVNGKKVLVK